MINKEDQEYIKATIENEGFDYAFMHKTDFKNIEDSRFHELREEYINSQKRLNEYVNGDVDKNLLEKYKDDYAFDLGLVKKYLDIIDDLYLVDFVILKIYIDRMAGTKGKIMALLEEKCITNPDDLYDGNVDIDVENKTLTIKAFTTYGAVNAYIHEMWSGQKDSHGVICNSTMIPARYSENAYNRSEWFLDDWTIVGMENIIKHALY